LCDSIVDDELNVDELLDVEPVEQDDGDDEGIDDSGRVFVTFVSRVFLGKEVIGTVVVVIVLAVEFQAFVWG
jgi:hypothetical protein